MPDKKHVHFIINPLSGVKGTRKLNFEETVAVTLDLSKYTFSAEYTESGEHVIECSKQAASKGVDVIVAVGGDGTANRVITGMAGSNSIFALIPAGSGNGLARFLNIPLDVTKGIEMINAFNVRSIDTVDVNGHIFASIAGVGFDALVARKFAKAERRGFLTYFRIALQAYPGYRPRKYRMIIDGEEVYRKALFVSFANSNQFGYNTVIAPEARIDDGFVDVCIVKKAPVLETPFILSQVWRNKIESSGYLEIIKAKEIILKRNKNKSINLDGEPVKVGNDLLIKVHPASLKMITPL